MDSLENLQIKYLTFDEHGEDPSFNDCFLSDNENHLHSELTELFETGYFFTNDKETGKQLCSFLNRHNLLYHIKSSTAFSVELYLNVS